MQFIAIILATARFRENLKSYNLVKAILSSCSIYLTIKLQSRVCRERKADKAQLIGQFNYTNEGKWANCFISINLLVFYYEVVF